MPAQAKNFFYRPGPNILTFIPDRAHIFLHESVRAELLAVIFGQLGSKIFLRVGPGRGELLTFIPSRANIFFVRAELVLNF